MPQVSPQATRVMIIDDHSVVRTGLRMLIESRPNLEVVAEAGNREEALAAAAQAKPKIILLNLEIGSERSLELIPDLIGVSAGGRVIVLTAVDSSELHRRAIQLGAIGLILKDQAAEVLLKAIDRVQAGEVWIDRVMMASVLSEMVQTSPDKQLKPEKDDLTSLTERELEVITLVCEGLQNKVIAQQLSISDTTVRHHLTSIYNKLGVSNRLELVIYSYRHRLVEPPH